MAYAPWMGLSQLSRRLVFVSFSPSPSSSLCARPPCFRKTRLIRHEVAQRASISYIRLQLCHLRAGRLKKLPAPSPLLLCRLLQDIFGTCPPAPRLQASEILLQIRAPPFVFKISGNLPASPRTGMSENSSLLPCALLPQSPVSPFPPSSLLVELGFRKRSLMNYKHSLRILNMFLICEREGRCEMILYSRSVVISQEARIYLCTNSLSTALSFHGMGYVHLPVLMTSLGSLVLLYV